MHIRRRGLRARRTSGTTDMMLARQPVLSATQSTPGILASLLEAVNGAPGSRRQLGCRGTSNRRIAIVRPTATKQAAGMLHRVLHDVNARKLCERYERNRRQDQTAHEFRASKSSYRVVVLRSTNPDLRNNKADIENVGDVFR